MVYARPMNHDFLVAATAHIPGTLAEAEAYIVGAMAAGLDALYWIDWITDRPFSLLPGIAALADSYSFPIWIFKFQNKPRFSPLPPGTVPNPPLLTQVQGLQSHPSVIGFPLWSEPALGDCAQIGTWSDQIKALDPLRPVTGELFPDAGDVAAEYTAIHGTALAPDPWTCLTTNAAMDLTVVDSTFAVVPMRSYLASATSSKPVSHPLWGIPQAFGGYANLRTPTAAEIHAQFWVYVAAGANSVNYFEYTQASEPGGDVGFDCIANHAGMRAAIADLITNNLGRQVRIALKRTVVRSNNWTATNSCLTATLGNQNRALSGAGARTFVVVYNPTTTTRVTGLAPIAGGPFNLTNLHAGTTQAGVVGNTYSLASGHGLLFETS